MPQPIQLPQVNLSSTDGRYTNVPVSASYVTNPDGSMVFTISCTVGSTTVTQTQTASSQAALTPSAYASQVQANLNQYRQSCVDDAANTEETKTALASLT